MPKGVSATAIGEAVATARQLALARGHRWLRQIESGKSANLSAVAKAENVDDSYLTRQGVDAHGLRVFKGALVVPICDAAGELHSLQFIGASGSKRSLKHGRVAGIYFQTGVAGKVVCIAQGYATGASIHAATGYAVAVAFNAGKLGHVTAAIRQSHPDAQLIVCTDDDVGTPCNPGLDGSEERVTNDQWE